MLDVVFTSSSVSVPGAGSGDQMFGTPMGIGILNSPTATSPDTIYLMYQYNGPAGPGLTHIGIVVEQFDASTGASLGPLAAPIEPPAFFLADMLQSRTGKFYLYQTGFLSGPLIELALPYTEGATVANSTFFAGLSSFGNVAIDETAGVLVNGGSKTLGIYNWNSGALMYSLPAHATVIAVCLAQEGCAYILGDNGILVLLNYVTGEVMGAMRLPAPPSGTNWRTLTGGVVMTFYQRMNRLLVCEYQGTGGLTTNIVGYLCVPIPTRLTKPVPLKTPFQGSTIPALVQCVGDMNEGLSAGLLSTSVTGTGSEVGFALSDSDGKAAVQVLCSAVGSVAINCTATVPDPATD